MNQSGASDLSDRLCLRRHEIMHFLAARQQDYVTDHTNLEDEYARNKVRLNIVPQLEAINPRAVDNMSTTMDNLREVYNIYIWCVFKADGLYDDRD